jgi:signal peptidase I
MQPEWWHWAVSGIVLILAELVVPAFVLVWFGLGALLVALVVAARVFLADARMTADAMAPTFSSGERVLALRLPYLIAPPQRGDVALVRAPQAGGALVARRVIGLPGEKINVRGRQTLVNDVVLAESYLAPALPGETINFTGEFKLQSDEYLLLSDSRETQIGFGDGRSWGAVSSSRILGRVFLTYWPLSAIRLVGGN